jgi:hypothetical protein
MISGRAYRHTSTHYAYSCSVDWQGVVMAGAVMALRGFFNLFNMIDMFCFTDICYNFPIKNYCVENGTLNHYDLLRGEDCWVSGCGGREK